MSAAIPPRGQVEQGNGLDSDTDLGFGSRPPQDSASASASATGLGSDPSSAALTRSPLAMISSEPLVHELIAYLSDARVRIQAQTDGPYVLRFSAQSIEAVRAAFNASIRRGEAKLHKLCELLGSSLLNGSYDMQSVVIGETQQPVRERFTLVQPLAAEVLYKRTDLDLGNRMLRQVRFRHGRRWDHARLVANFIEYQPHAENSHAIHKMISRIKAEEEIWNKVVDEIFDLDALVQRDKQLREHSRFVKDVFGIKIVVGSTSDVVRLHEHLTRLSWSHEQRAPLDLPSDAVTDKLQFVETKNYLGEVDAKASGWEAIKSVVTWWGKLFEIQIQPLGNYFLEREFLTTESHTGFKQRREQVRNSVADRFPLFRFYRDLLQWLFLRPNTPTPSYGGVRIENSEG